MLSIDISRLFVLYPIGKVEYYYVAYVLRQLKAAGSAMTLPNYMIKVT